jgi:uncharacterized membrane protein YccF (DUF307 family)|tara:strand:+ start:138 stop:506 length:369 start_codon:yes stop_codon:yes gene_type:complete
MKLLGNLIWLLFGGVFIALEYFLASILLCLTVVGIPFGIQTFKLALIALWPFGKEYSKNQDTSGILSTIMNIIWFFIGGIWISLSHVIMGILFYITILGIPFGKQHMKLAGLALAPFGRSIS